MEPRPVPNSRSHRVLWNGCCWAVRLVRQVLPQAQAGRLTEIELDRSHELYVTRVLETDLPVFFCMRCGSHASGQPWRLAKDSTNVVTAQRKQLLSGRLSWFPRANVSPVLGHPASRAREGNGWPN
eukprot:6580862-Pyramimonas_sp.AAC.1